MGCMGNTEAGSERILGMINHLPVVGRPLVSLGGLAISTTERLAKSLGPSGALSNISNQISREAEQKVHVTYLEDHISDIDTRHWGLSALCHQALRLIDEVAGDDTDAEDKLLRLKLIGEVLDSVRGNPFVGLGLHFDEIKKLEAHYYPPPLE